MRTVNEILAKITEVAGDDLFGAQRTELVSSLPFSAAQANGFVKEGVAEETWTTHQIGTDDAVIKAMVGYLPFAIGKATDHRGLSASRSLDHMRGWLWLLGDDDLLAIADDGAQYRPYGGPILGAIVKKYAPDLPAAKTPEFERMAAGRPCEDYCQDGC